MTTVHWTPEAKTRLRAIEAYIAKDTSASAHAVVQRILARTRQLNTVPFSGRQVPDYRREELRELLERPYRIIYRVTASRVEILTLMHYRQLLPDDPDHFQAE
jgi:toxin ParE1/3/4